MVPASEQCATTMSYFFNPVRRLEPTAFITDLVRLYRMKSLRISAFTDLIRHSIRQPFQEVCKKIKI